MRIPGSTRTELAEHTGLSRPTVSTVADELVQAGLVTQHDDSQPRTGRPPVLLSLAPGAAFAVGVDMGHAHVQVAVSDLSGEILGHRRADADVDHDPVASLDLARDLVQHVLEQAGVTNDRVIGVGMAFSAPLDRTSGAILAEGILPSWSGIQPAVEMQARLGLPVEVRNDANLGALGEHTFGAGRGAADMLYVRLSAGIGLGLVLDGHPYGGTSGIAGRARPSPREAGRPDLPLRQPRLPGDRGELGGGRAAARAQPGRDRQRRAAARARRPRRPRRDPRGRGGGAGDRRGPGLGREPLQPAAAARRRRSRRDRRRGARSAAGGDRLSTRSHRRPTR